MLLVALLAGGVYFGFDHGGGAAGSQSAQAGLSGGAASGVGVAAGRWAPSRGPYGGHAYVVAAAPSARDVVYVGTLRGVFASRNGGRSWQAAGLAAQGDPLTASDPRITSLAVDPRAPATIYAARGMELFKSTSGGRSWRALGIAARLVFVSPADPDAVYAITGARWDETNRLFRSTNGGGRWQPADHGLAATFFSGLAFDPTARSTVYAAAGRGVLKSTDGGVHWRRASRQAASAVAVDPRDPRTVYAGTDGGLIKSLNGGQSWRLVNTAMGSHGRDRAQGQVSSLVVHPLDSQRLYATARCMGIFRSSDGGRSWSSANAVRNPRCQDTAVALASRAPQTIYGVYASRGAFKSSDGGDHWRASNTGLSLVTVSSLAVDANRPETVYASAGQLGLFKSSDGGADWRPVAVGIVDAVALDQRDPRIVLAASATPRVVRSTDAGRTWHAAGAVRQCCLRRPTAMATRPLALAISGTHAYAATYARGVYASSDGGRSWREPASPPRSYAQTLAIAPGHPAVVYAGFVGSKARGLYRSTDAGRTWQHLTHGVEDTDVSAVALDPTHPATIYIGGRGLFKSIDGGANWQPASTGLTAAQVTGITVLAIDPANPTTLYAASFGSGIFRSTDAGSSWHPFNAGLADLEVKSLAVDATGRTLYAGSAGGGVVTLHAGAS